MIPGLTQTADGAYEIGAAAIPATAELTAGQTVTVNGVVYTLVKYLGGGTYGKVWATNDNKSLKFIKVSLPDAEDEEVGASSNAARKQAILEAKVSKILHTKTISDPICSDIYGIGELTIGADIFIVIVMDKFDQTVDTYLETGGSGKADEILCAFYRASQRVNLGRGFITVHGDPKGDNFMFKDGKIKWIDVGFLHLKDGGRIYTLNSHYNSHNFTWYRDLVQFLIYFALFYPLKISSSVFSIILPTIIELRARGGITWHKAYEYVNDNTKTFEIATLAVKILKGLNCEEKPAEFTQPYVDEEVEEEGMLETVETVEKGGDAFKATIEEKMSVKSEPYATEATNFSASASASAPESKRRKSSGGARKTRRHSRSRKTRKRKSKRKTRSK